MMFALAGLKLLMLGGFLIAAVFLDVHSRRIPNGLCALMLVTGLVLQTVFAGVDGLLSAVGGVVTGFAVLLPMYLIGRMGAGDVKLLASVGAFLGATGALTAGVATLVIGGVIGGGVVMWNQFRMWGAANDVIGFRGHAPDMLWQIELPYAVAIATGTATALSIDSPLHLLGL